MTETGVTGKLPVELSLERRIELSRCLTDFHAIHTYQGLTGELLVTGKCRTAGEITDVLAGELTRAAEANAARWRRLWESADFLRSLGPLITDEVIHSGLRMAGIAESPAAREFMQRVQNEGAAQFVRSRLDGLKPALARQLDQAIALYAYWASWPAGRDTDGRSTGIVAGFHGGSTLACVAGAVLIGAGGIAVGIAVAETAATAGLAGPLAAPGGLAGAGAMLLGGVLVGAYC